MTDKTEETKLPAPLTPADCDLRGLEWMPLDVVNITESDLFMEASGDEFKAAFSLWCKSWRQVPAGSLPNKEAVLAGLSGARNWKKVRDVAMRNWVLCSDNRWYHPVVAAKALEAWPSRQAFERKKSADAERKAREREARSALFELLRSHNIVPSYDTKTSQLRELAKPFQPQPVTHETVTGHVTCDVTVTARTGTGTGTGTGEVNPTVEPVQTDAAKASDRFDAKAWLVTRGVASQHATDWLKNRKAKRLASTLTAFEDVEREAEKAGLSLPKALETACIKGWGGFRASWLTEGGPRPENFENRDYGNGGRL